jgi:hypothetical protein
LLRIKLLGKGLHDESRAESRHVSAVKLSPRVWGEFEEAACDDGDVARDPEALREAALHALRLDCSKRSDEDVVAIGDWMLQVFRLELAGGCAVHISIPCVRGQSDHELAPIFQSWRQPWYQTSNSCGDRQRKGPENMLSPSNVSETVRRPAPVSTALLFSMFAAVVSSVLFCSRSNVILLQL